MHIEIKSINVDGKHIRAVNGEYGVIESLAGHHIVESSFSVDLIKNKADIDEVIKALQILKINYLE